MQCLVTAGNLHSHLWVKNLALLQADAHFLRNRLKRLKQISKNAVVPVYNLSSLQTVSEALRDMMGFYHNGTRSLLEDKLQTCAAMNLSNNEDEKNNLTSSNSSFWSSNFPCISVLPHLNQTFSNKFLQEFDVDFSELIPYEENMKLLFRNIQKIPDLTNGYEQCSLLKRELLEKAASLQSLADLALALTIANTLPEAFQFASNITMSVAQPDFTDFSTTKLFDECNVFTKLFNLDIKIWDRAVGLMESVDIPDVMQRRLENAVTTLHKFLSHSIAPYLKETKAYLSGTTSKGELAVRFLSLQFGKKVNKLLHKASDLVTDVNSYTEEMIRGAEALLAMLNSLILPVRVVSSSDIQDLALLSLGSNMTDEQVKELRQNLSDPSLTYDQRTNLLKEYTSKILPRYVNQVDKISNVEFMVDDVNDNIITFRENLQKYDKENNMGTEFFM